MSWQDRIVGMESVAPGTLTPNPRNWRRHPDAQGAVLTQVLEEVGWVDQVIVNKQTGFIVDGHERVELAIKNDIDEVPVLYVDLTPDEEALILATFDPIGAMAKTDADQLAELTADIGADGEVQKLLESILEADVKTVGESEVPEPPDEPMTQKGDIWVLGNHRLMCGDSSSTEDLDKLLAGNEIHIVNTDPPYNVKVEPRSNNAIAAGLSSFEGTAHHQKMHVAKRPGAANGTTKKMRPKDRPLENDFVSDDAFDILLAAWFGNISRCMAPGGGFYIWGGYANCANYPPALATAKLYFSQAIIWKKGHPVLTRKDFMGEHEWCFYGWKEGAAHRFFGPKNIPDVWDVKKINPQSMIHLTEKPVELAARAIQYSSLKGENVLDLFGGSGSTLMAAEQLGRHAFLMEIDTLYCDVILQRWANETGETPVREQDGALFQAVDALTS